MYTGVKCVSFRFAHGRPGAVSAALFASSVAWAAAENILGVKAVETFTIRSGVLRRAYDARPLPSLSRPLALFSPEPPPARADTLG